MHDALNWNRPLNTQPLFPQVAMHQSEFVITANISTPSEINSVTVWLLRKKQIISTVWTIVTVNKWKNFVNDWIVKSHLIRWCILKKLEWISEKRIGHMEMDTYFKSIFCIFVDNIINLKKVF